MAAVLFVMRYPLDHWENLRTKFDGQMKAAGQMGHQVSFIGFGQGALWLCDCDGNRTLLHKTPFMKFPAYEKSLFYIDLFRALAEASERRHFDLIYMRYLTVFGNAPGSIQKAKANGCKLVMELPTYPIQNGRTTNWLRKSVFWYSDRVFARLEKDIDLYTLIGDPCGATLHGIPAMNIVNGVDATTLPLHQTRKEGALSFLALASMSHWQGYDRLIRALAEYDGDEKIIVHMAGGEGDGSLARWKALAEELHLRDRVIFHGAIHGEALDRLVEECDVGIGGLGLYRKHQFQSMTLKLREYTARGLPFVYAVEDPSIPKNCPWCLQVPNDDSAIDMRVLASFAKKTRESIDLPGLMRAYAVEHMSWQGVLKPVLERMNIS